MHSWYLKRDLFCSMKKSIVFFFALCLFLIARNAIAQLPNYAPDSIIYYQLPSLDTNKKVPVTKETFTYNQHYVPLEKNFYRWDPLQRQWLHEARYKFLYLKNEIIVEKYTIQNNRNEILIARNLAKTDQNNRIIETTLLTKDRYSNKHDRRNKYELTYTNDTLSKVAFFEQGTTFFQQREMNFKYLPLQLIVNEKTFSETAGLVSEIERQYFFKNKRQNVCKIFDKTTKTLVRTDSFCYHLDSLLATYSIVAPSQQALKPSHDASAITKYDYYLSGHLKSVTKLILDNKQAPKSDYANTLIRYFVNVKSPVSIGKSYSFDISDF